MLEEGKYNASFGKNMTTTSNTPTVADLNNGAELRGQAVSANLQNSSTDEVRLFSVEVTSIHSIDN